MHVYLLFEHKSRPEHCLGPQFRYALHDISERTNAEVKGAVLTRLVQLALRYVFTEQPVERLRELLRLIALIEDRSEATRVLYTLLRYFVQANRRVGETEVRLPIDELPNGEALMQTFLDRYVQKGEATVLLRLIERKFGPPSDSVRQRIEEADAATLLEWSERILDAKTLEAVLH